MRLKGKESFSVLSGESPKIDGTSIEEIFLSVIIPSYNEGAQIKENVHHIDDYLKGQNFSYEIIVVDDGSQDDTLSKLKGLDEELKLRIFTSRENRGKGYAVKKGMLESKGKYSLFLDADLSAGIEELPKFLEALEVSFQVTIGSRRLKDSVILVHQGKLRELIGHIFTKLTNFILSGNISDYTCGFKSFGREAVEGIFRKQRILGWSYDAEILYIARRQGYRIKEIPITWRNERHSKVRIFRDVIKSFIGLIGIRINALAGRYRN